MFETFLQQLATTATQAATSTPETWTGFIIAIATLVSGLSGLISHYVMNPKVKAVADLSKASADKVIESKLF
jgi:hypothetical protein